MTSTIYLDHNASTPPHPAALEVMMQAYRDVGGNPGSRHSAGRKARQILEAARETVARILEAKPSEVVFTSGGTESSNLALCGLAAGRMGVVALPPGEHPATEETVRHLESHGWARAMLSIDDDGRLVDASLDDVPWNDVRLVTALLAHNETGVIQDFTRLSSLCCERGIPFHVDAVQAAGKIDVRFHSLGASTLSIAAHKFRGPRGIGALLVRDGVNLSPVEFGGHQEAGRRPGTECTALAAGMAKALELWNAERESITTRVESLRNRLEGALQQRCAPVVINGGRAKRLPNTLNIAFPGCDGDALLVALDLAGVCVSLGSACASGSAEPAPILVAMDCGPEIYKSSLRFSLGATTTAEEIDEAAERIVRVVERLRSR